MLKMLILRSNESEFQSQQNFQLFFLAATETTRIVEHSEYINSEAKSTFILNSYFSFIFSRSQLRFYSHGKVFHFDDFFFFFCCTSRSIENGNNIAAGSTQKLRANTHKIRLLKSTFSFSLCLFCRRGIFLFFRNLDRQTMCCFELIFLRF